MWFKRSAWKVKQKYHIHTYACLKSTQVKFGSSSNMNSLCPNVCLFVCCFVLSKHDRHRLHSPLKGVAVYAFSSKQHYYIYVNHRITLRRHQHSFVAKPGSFLRKKLHSRWRRRRRLWWWRHQLARSNDKIYVWSSIHHYCLTYLPLREIHHYVRNNNK